MKISKNNLKGFIFEMLLLIVCITLILSGLLYNQLITITIRIHILTIALLILTITLLIYLYCKIINIGIKALCDFIISGETKIRGTCIKQYPFSASVFADKWDKNYEVRNDIRYYIVIKTSKNEHITLLSPGYLNVIDGMQYTFYIGKSSHIILAFEE